MPKQLWFLSLIFLSIALFGYMLWKEEKKTVFALYSFISGLSFIFDYVIFVLLESYIYKPKFFKEGWFDNVFGSSISQGMAVPVVATFLIIFRLKWYWYFFFMSMFIGIEYLFTELSLYQHVWWKYSYTGVFILVAFLLTKWWNKQLKSPKTLVKLVTLYLAIITLENTLYFYLVYFFRFHLFTPGFFQDEFRDHFAGNSLYIFVYSILLALVCSSRLRWYSIASVGVFGFISYYSMAKAGLIEISHFWNVGYFVFLITLMTFFYRMVSTKLLQFD